VRAFLAMYHPSRQLHLDTLAVELGLGPITLQWIDATVQEVSTEDEYDTSLTAFAMVLE